MGSNPAPCYFSFWFFQPRSVSSKCISYLWWKKLQHENGLLVFLPWGKTGTTDKIGQKRQPKFYPYWSQAIPCQNPFYELKIWALDFEAGLALPINLPFQIAFLRSRIDHAELLNVERKNDLQRIFSQFSDLIKLLQVLILLCLSEISFLWNVKSYSSVHF